MVLDRASRRASDLSTHLTNADTTATDTGDTVVVVVIKKKKMR
jgi:hypothetical protein